MEETALVAGFFQRKVRDTETANYTHTTIQPNSYKTIKHGCKSHSLLSSSQFINIAQFSSTAIILLVLGLIFFFVAVPIALYYIFRLARRQRLPTQAPPGDIERPSTVNDSTVRRKTGKTQTLVAWVQAENSKGNEGRSRNHDRVASLENGPGPIIRDETFCHHRAASLKHGPGPVVREDDSSSLRQAVMGAGEEEEVETVAKEDEKEDRKKDVGVRGYSGAWP